MQLFKQGIKRQNDLGQNNLVELNLKLFSGGFSNYFVPNDFAFSWLPE
jgi:hypothetical protein